MVAGIRGRAQKGSRRQLQNYVNRHPGELSDLLLSRSATLRAFGTAGIRWASPLAHDDYREYSGVRMLETLGLAHLRVRLREFWPSPPPYWDGLAIVRGAAGQEGYLLVEAKSHLGEVTSRCGATISGKGRQRIDAAFASLSAYLRVDQTAAWRQKHYQYMNRLAHLYFLRVRCDLHAWLACIYFVGGHSLDLHTAPDDEATWREGADPTPGLQRMMDALGLPERHPLEPYVVETFPSALAVPAP